MTNAQRMNLPKGRLIQHCEEHNEWFDPRFEKCPKCQHEDERSATDWYKNAERVRIMVDIGINNENIPSWIKTK